MKKLLIVSDSLRVGGIQHSLKNLLNLIDYSNYDVTLFLFHNESNYKYKINKNVQVISGNRLLSIANTTAQEARQKGRLYFVIRKIIAGLCLVMGSSLVYKFMFLFEKKKCGYDVAISFSNNINNRSVYFGSNKFVLEKTVADRKITWLHVDYKEMKLNKAINKKEYEKFDSIVHVSYAVKQTFLSYYPELKEKCKVIYNAVPVDEINILSNEYEPPKSGLVTIVSVGRLEAKKSPKSYIYVARCLKNKGVDFRWWVIGDGPEKTEVRTDLLDNNLADNVILLGGMDNPYPYIKNADLFVSASKSESFGLAIAEALVLKTPVVARYYPAIEELIADKINGLISYGDDESLADSVLNVLNDTELYRTIKTNSALTISDQIISEQFDDLMRTQKSGGPS